MALTDRQNFRIEEKVLEFDLELLDAQFNNPSRYFLKFCVNSLATRDYSRVQLKKGATAEYIYDSEVITDVIVVEDGTKNCTFQESFFSFKLPKGFLKNDKNHDVYLLVEAYTLPDNDEDMGKKVGEGKVAIYPRTNAPRIDTSVPRGDNMYHFTDIMTILRTVSSDELKMHCGRLKCTLSLREEKPPPPPPPKTPTMETPNLSEFLRDSTPVAASKGKDTSPKITEPTQYLSPPVQPTPSPMVTPVRSLTPTPKPDEKSPDNSWAAESTPEQLKFQRTSPTPPPLGSGGRQMAESPLPENVRTTFTVNPGIQHVARRGRERLDVILHGAIGVPSPRNETIPQPYVTLKSRSDEDNHIQAQAVSHAPVHPSHTPLWEELLTVEVDDKTALDEFLVLTLGDKLTRQSLVTYRIPLSYMKPYHQYHLELVMPSKSIPYGIRTYVTITRKTSKLPRDLASPNYCGLEVLLCAVQKQLRNPVGPLIAVARVVPDYYTYKDDNLLSKPRSAGVTLTSVTCPSPHPSSFTVPDTQSQGYPQITLPGHPEEQPEWNHPFLFSEQRENATMFTPSAALVIEYYTVSEVMSDEFWRVRSPCGFSTLLLDENAYKQLISDRGRVGLRVEGLPIQGSGLQTVDQEMPTVGMILRLITSEHPESVVSVSDRENLPVLDMFPKDSASAVSPYQAADYYRLHSPEVLIVESVSSVTSTPDLDIQQPHPSTRMPVYAKRKVLKRPLSLSVSEPPPTPHSVALATLYFRPYTSQPVKDGDFPPFDALETVLPEYQYIFVDPDQTSRPPPPAHAPVPHKDVPAEPQSGPSRVPVAESGQIPSSLLDHQLKELENYRAAVHKMGQDILALRQQIRDQEAMNSQLRRDLTHYDDSTKFILDSTELDGLTKPELAARYASLKQKLASQTSDVKAYKDRVQKLQNEIIKKNDQEKALLKVRDAHEDQQELLQKVQDKARKVSKLEEACRKQEKVIDKMEKLVERQKDKKYMGNLEADTHDALMEENRRLRQELEDTKDSGRRGEGKSTTDDAEKLELYQALDKAEGRIMSLEKQLAENSRQWGRERADMALRLNEAEHGFGRTGGSPNFGRHSFGGTEEPRRYSKAPLPRRKHSPKIGLYY